MINKLRKPLHFLAPVLIVAASVFHSVPASGAETKSKLESEPEGWVDILPPADLKGWYRVPVPPTGKLGREQWHVDAEKKVLICDGDGGHDMLLSDKEFGDAIFHFEFRYTKVEGKTGYNSGAYVRNSKDGAIWHQAQFGDAQGRLPVRRRRRRRTARRSSSTLNKKVTDMRVKPAGEWNTIEVTARGQDADALGQRRGHLPVRGLRPGEGLRRPGGRRLPHRVPQSEGQAAPLSRVLLD